MFNKAAYKARFINISTVRPDKQKESDVLQGKVDDFESLGGKIERVGFGVSNSIHKSYKEKSSQGLMI